MKKLSSLDSRLSTDTSNWHLFHGLTSVLGAVSCDGVERQVGANVPGTDDGHVDPVVLHLSPQAVEVGLGGVFGGCV